MSARTRGTLTGALVCVLGLTSYVPGALADPAPAHALEATRVWLDWETGPGTEGCISRDDAAKEVERTLGRRVFVAREEAERTLHVQLERAETPSRYSAHMTLLSARGTPLGERDITIESTSCAGATDGITLALSIMADLARTREEEEEAKTPPAMPPSPPVATTPPPVRPPPRPAEKRNERRWQGFVGFGPAVTFDGNADFAPGLHVFGLVDPPGFLPLALSGLQTVRPFDTPQGGTFWQSTSQIDASVCAPSLRRGKFELDGCLGPQATLYVAWGSGLMENRSGVSATFGGALRVYGTVAVARGVRLFGTLGLSATPQRIDIKTLDLNGQKMSIHETSTVTAVSSIGVALDIF